MESPIEPTLKSQFPSPVLRPGMAHDGYQANAWNHSERETGTLLLRRLPWVYGHLQSTSK